MYTFDEQPEEFARLNAAARELSLRIIAALTPLQRNATIPAQHELFQGGAERKRLYFIKEGALAYARGTAILFFYDPGDLVGFEQHFCDSDARVRSEFAVIVDEYDFTELTKKISTDAALREIWDKYLAIQLALLGMIASNSQAHNTDELPQLRCINPGEVIIKEGDKAEEVFNLVEGEADVFVGGVKVGEILSDEIFGAMAALADKPRSATVIARTNCLVLGLPRENFNQLIQSRPHTVQKMVVDMARMVIALNERVVGLSALIK